MNDHNPEVSIELNEAMNAIKSVMRVPAQRLKRGQTWMGQKVDLLTVLFGKEYYWLRDGDGTVYLAKVGKDGLPNLS